jgi:hypothetical protein
MTQDQYGQARGSGYVAGGDVVPDDETGDYPDEQARQKTRFQKVASALLGDKPDRDEENGDEPTANRVSASPEEATGSDVTARDPGTQAADPPRVTEQDEAATANSPVSREVQGTGRATSPAAARAGETAAAGSGSPRPDYWDEPGATEDERVAVTRPDARSTDPAARQGQAPGQAGPDIVDHPATEPDMVGNTADAGNEPGPYSEGQPGAATIADVPAASETAGTAGRHEAAPAAGTSAAAIPAAGASAAGTPAAGGMRPGEAAGALGDFSDLAYGNLVPDAEQYATQWQQIQFRFVDDPHASVTEAAEVVAQVTAKMEAAIQERQRAVQERQHAIAEQQRSLRERWGEGSNADTEAMRETLRMYKTFLDQLIGPRAS